MQDMVIKVYNLDGPGFKFDTKKLYKKNKEKLVKIVPHDDVVGILLNDPSELIICKSSEVNVNAHDLLTWQFDFFNKYKTLTRTKELTIYSETLRITINEFIKEIGIDNVKDVKTAIFEIVKINKVKDVIYIYEAALKNIHNGLTEMRRENPEQVKQMEQLIKLCEKEKNILEENKALISQKRIIFLNYVSDAELTVLYNEALATLFPSRYEGFGFPILESFDISAILFKM